MSIDDQNTTPINPSDKQRSTGSGAASDPDETIPSGSTKISMGLAGKMIGHYKLIKELGQGGQGYVYLAEDINLHRHASSGSRGDLSPKLPHHRAYGSVHGGSHKDCKASMFLGKVRESKLTKGLLCKHKVHVARSSIPPRTAPVPRRFRGAVRKDA